MTSVHSSQSLFLHLKISHSRKQNPNAWIQSYYRWPSCAQPNTRSHHLEIKRRVLKSFRVPLSLYRFEASTCKNQLIFFWNSSNRGLSCTDSIPGTQKSIRTPKYSIQIDSAKSKTSIAITLIIWRLELVRECVWGCGLATHRPRSESWPSCGISSWNFHRDTNRSFRIQNRWFGRRKMAFYWILNRERINERWRKLGAEASKK